MGDTHKRKVLVELQRLWKLNWHWNQSPQNVGWGLYPEPHQVNCSLKQTKHNLKKQKTEQKNLHDLIPLALPLEKKTAFIL